MSPSHQPYEELAAGHALGALEPADEQAFLAHLAGCARCERDLAEHGETLAHLAYAAPAAEPPASLLEGIRAGVAASGRGAVFDAPAPVAAEAPDELAAARARRDRSRLGRSGAWVGVAAAAALVLGLGAWNTSLQRERDAQEAWGGRLAAAVQSLQDTATETVPLSSPDGRVLAVAVVSGDQMSLVVDGLERNDADSTTYVLWGKSRFGDVRPVGAFDVPREGLDVLSGMQLPDGVADVTTFMLTREQGDVAPPMTTQPVLASGELSA